MEIAALCMVCLAIGLVIGYEWGERKGRKRAAPAPALPDYDVDNPINQGVNARKVIECGREWTVYGGR